MSTQADNKELVRNYLQAFNDRDYDAVREILAEDVVEHSVHEELHGPEEVVEFLESYFDTFPDYSGETEAMVAEDDKVVVRYTASGTQSGEYESVEPTVQGVEWSGIAMYQVENGEIAEVWIEEDRLGVLEELEAVDPPGHLRI